MKRRFVPTLKRIRSVRPYVPGISHLAIAATPAHEARLVAEETPVQAELDRLARDRERVKRGVPMLTPEILKSIDLLLPAQDRRGDLLRRAVRALAAADGVLPLSRLCVALDRNPHSLYAVLTPWDGIRWEGTEGNITARLAPFVRAAIGLPVTSAELRTDLGAATQDDDEPTAYHRPVPLQALLGSLPVYTVEDVDALLNGPRYVPSGLYRN